MFHGISSYILDISSYILSTAISVCVSTQWVYTPLATTGPWIPRGSAAMEDGWRPRTWTMGTMGGRVARWPWLKGGEVAEVAEVAEAWMHSLAVLWAKSPTSRLPRWKSSELSLSVLRLDTTSHHECSVWGMGLFHKKENLGPSSIHKRILVSPCKHASKMIKANSLTSEGDFNVWFHVTSEDRRQPRYPWWVPWQHERWFSSLGYWSKAKSILEPLLFLVELSHIFSHFLTFSHSSTFCGRPLRMAAWHWGSSSVFWRDPMTQNRVKDLPIRSFRRGGSLEDEVMNDGRWKMLADIVSIDIDSRSSWCWCWRADSGFGQHIFDLQLKFEEHHQVAPDATESEITKQYRRLSVWHLETRHGHLNWCHGFTNLMMKDDFQIVIRWCFAGRLRFWFTRTSASSRKLQKHFRWISAIDSQTNKT